MVFSRVHTFKAELIAECKSLDDPSGYDVQLSFIQLVFTMLKRVLDAH